MGISIVLHYTKFVDAMKNLSIPLTYW